MCSGICQWTDTTFGEKRYLQNNGSLLVTICQQKWQWMCRDISRWNSGCWNWICGNEIDGEGFVGVGSGEVGVVGSMDFSP